MGYSTDYHNTMLFRYDEPTAQKLVKLKPGQSFQIRLASVAEAKRRRFWIYDFCKLYFEKRRFVIKVMGDEAEGLVSVEYRKFDRGEVLG